jgi:hypothetical protein
LFFIQNNVFRLDFVPSSDKTYAVVPVPTSGHQHQHKNRVYKPRQHKPSARIKTYTKIIKTTRVRGLASEHYQNRSHHHDKPIKQQIKWSFWHVGTFLLFLIGYVTPSLLFNIFSCLLCTHVGPILIFQADLMTCYTCAPYCILLRVCLFCWCNICNNHILAIWTPITAEVKKLQLCTA